MQVRGAVGPVALFRAQDFLVKAVEAIERKGVGRLSLVFDKALYVMDIRALVAYVAEEPKKALESIGVCGVDAFVGHNPNGVSVNAVNNFSVLGAQAITKEGGVGVPGSTFFKKLKPLLA